LPFVGWEGFGRTAVGGHDGLDARDFVGLAVYAILARAPLFGLFAVVGAVVLGRAVGGGQLLPLHFTSLNFYFNFNFTLAD